jgi:hypothetical protein
MNIIYIDKYGNKSSTKLDRIALEAREYLYSRLHKKSWSVIMNSAKMQSYRKRFEIEAQRIGVDYELGDSLA